MQSYRFSNPKVCVSVSTAVEPCGGAIGRYRCSFADGTVMFVGAMSMAAAARKSVELYKKQMNDD